ncbi:DNA methylase [Methanobrevibacter curvatus]|uniref:DNA methylase n=2 Tax=Methanobrevibacter curvatus TaxID=49547 RepID=A0A165Z205_9EURY|nr:DNA methylase [Methanobrevibacter curvatus]
MMYPRLKLARNLLTNDGVIFISIDDNELNNLMKISDEIFGKSNLVTIITIKTGGPGGFKSKANKPVKVKEFVLIYAKNIEYYNYISTFVEKSGKWDTHFNSFYDHESNQVFPLIEILKKKKIVNENTKLSDLSLNQKEFQDFYRKYKSNIFDTKFYKDSEEKNKSLQSKDEVIIHKRTDGRKLYLLNGRLLNFLETSFKPINTTGTKAITTPLSDIWEDLPYNNIQNESNIPTFKSGQKPLNLIKRMLSMTDTNNQIILDFFSGSSTTAHAILELNALDNYKRKFIMVQIPEPIESKEELYKEGFFNIAEIGKERIRRAGDKIIEKSNNNDLDTGFKVFKLYSSNLKKWDPDYKDPEQALLTSGDNIKEDRTELDLIYEIMLKYGIDLTLPIKEFELNNKKIYSIGFGSLLICLDNNITKEIATEIIKLKKELSPETTRIVFKDNGFASDSDKTNIKETLKTNNIDEFITI